MSDSRNISNSKSLLSQTLQCENTDYTQNPYKSKFISQFHRETFTNWIFETTETLNGGLKSSYLACIYLDIFLCKIPIPNIEILELLSLTCISIALKFNESKPLTIEKRHLILKSKYSKEIITEVELYILSNLNWNLHYFTIPDIINEIVPSNLINRENIIKTASSFATLLITDEFSYKSGTTAISLASISVALNFFKASCLPLIDYEELVEKNTLAQLETLLKEKVNYQSKANN